MASNQGRWLAELGSGRFYQDNYNQAGKWCRFYWDEMAPPQPGVTQFNSQPAARAIPQLQSNPRTILPSPNQYGQSNPYSVLFPQPYQLSTTSSGLQGGQFPAAPQHPGLPTYQHTGSSFPQSPTSQGDYLAGRLDNIGLNYVYGSEQASSSGGFTHASHNHNPWNPATAPSPSYQSKNASGLHPPQGLIPQWQSTADSGGQPGASADKGKGKAEISQPSQQNTIAPAVISLETLKKNFKSRNHDYKKFFSTGRVFQTLVTEPFLTLTADKHFVDPSDVHIVSFGEQVYSKVRRYIVVQRTGRHCTCLRITSYHSRAAGKPGIDLNKHGMIYSTPNPPPPTPGISKKPLKVDVSNARDHFNDKSMINYSRPESIDTNVKVNQIGQLDGSSVNLLIEYYNRNALAMPKEVRVATPASLSHDQDLKFMGPAANAGSLGSGADEAVSSLPGPSGYSPTAISSSFLPSAMPPGGTVALAPLQSPSTSLAKRSSYFPAASSSQPTSPQGAAPYHTLMPQPSQSRNADSSLLPSVDQPMAASLFHGTNVLALPAPYSTTAGSNLSNSSIGQFTSSQPVSMADYCLPLTSAGGEGSSAVNQAADLDEEIILPTLENAKEAKERRPSHTSSSKLSSKSAKASSTRRHAEKDDKDRKGHGNQDDKDKKGHSKKDDRDKRGSSKPGRSK